MDKYIWGRKLVANEIRPLIYKLTESFRKYEAVQDYDILVNKIKTLNSALSDEDMLKLLNKLSEEKYHTQDKIKKINQINDEVKKVAVYRKKIENFDKDLELKRIQVINDYHFNLKVSDKDLDESVLHTDPFLYEKLKKFSVEYSSNSVGDKTTLLERLNIEYKEMQAEFCSYYFVKHLEKQSEEKQDLEIEDLKQKKYFDASQIIPHVIIRQSDFLYSYIRVDQVNIDNVNLYFNFKQPEYDIEKKLNELRKESAEITAKIEDIFKTKIKRNEVEF